jgi:outer membrane cobalamin receptor
LRLDLEANNLADTGYEDVRGYAAPGREILLGFRYATAD